MKFFAHAIVVAVHYNGETQLSKHKHVPEGATRLIRKFCKNEISMTESAVVTGRLLRHIRKISMTKIQRGNCQQSFRSYLLVFPWKFNVIQGFAVDSGLVYFEVNRSLSVLILASVTHRRFSRDCSIFLQAGLVYSSITRWFKICLTEGRIQRIFFAVLHRHEDHWSAALSHTRVTSGQTCNGYWDIVDSLVSRCE